MANNKKISVVIPVYNESGILERLVSSLQSVTAGMVFDFEFIFVNDDSRDGSLALLCELSKRDPRIKIIDFSRNFGHQAAISAGIDYAEADCVILMDADMEDRPEDLPKFIDKWTEGFEVVYAVRKSRRVSFLKKMLFWVFHSLNKVLSEVPMEPAGIFGLMDRRVVNEIKLLGETNRYIPGLRSWVGFRQASIVLDRGERYDRKPRVGLFKLFNLALDSYFSFSKKPMRLAAFLGFIFSFLSFIGALGIVVFQLVVKFKVSGWASLAAILLFVSSMQFICLGVMGEYIGRIFDEVKERPLYIVKKSYGIDKPAKAG